MVGGICHTTDVRLVFVWNLICTSTIFVFLFEFVGIVRMLEFTIFEYNYIHNAIKKMRKPKKVP